MLLVSWYAREGKEAHWHWHWDDPNPALLLRRIGRGGKADKHACTMLAPPTACETCGDAPVCPYDYLRERGIRHLDRVFHRQTTESLRSGFAVHLRP
jgi:hypothetical protein